MLELYLYFLFILYLFLLYLNHDQTSIRWNRNSKLIQGNAWHCVVIRLNSQIYSDGNEITFWSDLRSWAFWWIISRASQNFCHNPCSLADELNNIDFRAVINHAMIPCDYVIFMPHDLRWMVSLSWRTSHLGEKMPSLLKTFFLMSKSNFYSRLLKCRKYFRYHLKNYSCCEEPYPDITYIIRYRSQWHHHFWSKSDSSLSPNWSMIFIARIRRRPLFYVFNMIMPCVLINGIGNNCINHCHC